MMIASSPLVIPADPIGADAPSTPSVGARGEATATSRPAGQSRRSIESARSSPAEFSPPLFGQWRRRCCSTCGTRSAPVTVALEFQPLRGRVRSRDEGLRLPP